MAGNVRRLRRWTPIERPIRKAISMIHRPEYSSSAASSHFRIAQNTAAVNNEELEYTSPSTAENQNESENVNARAPVTPAEITAINLPVVNCDSSFMMIFLARCVIVQNRKRIVNALASADIE